MIRVGVGVGEGVEVRGGEAEEGPEAEGEAAKLLEGKAEEEVENLLAAQPLWIAGDVLARFRRHVRHPSDHRGVQHHLLYY